MKTRRRRRRRRRRMQWPCFAAISAHDPAGKCGI